MKFPKNNTRIKRNNPAGGRKEEKQEKKTYIYKVGNTR